MVKTRLSSPFPVSSRKGRGRGGMGLLRRPFRFIISRGFYI